MTAGPDPAAAGTAEVDIKPPTRSRVAGLLAVVAGASCCAIPVLVTAGVLTGAGAALLKQTLLALAAGLAVLALGMWWLHRRRTAAAGSSTGRTLIGRTR